MVSVILWIIEDISTSVKNLIRLIAIRERGLHKRTIAVVFSTLLFISTLVLVFNIQLVKATGTIYIRADGSIDPPTAPIQQDGDTYTFLDNMNDSIVVQSSNIVVDGSGYTLQGLGSGYGFYLEDVSNVTIRNANVNGFFEGIYLDSASQSTVVGNNVASNGEYGIYLNYSSNNDLNGNSVRYNGDDGVHLWFSDNNSIRGNSITGNGRGVYIGVCNRNSLRGNNITNNSFYGVALGFGLQNNLSENNITDNSYGFLVDAYYNFIYHNNIVANYLVDVELMGLGYNTWDNGYPAGGNYWGGYSGFDLRKGEYQNETGSDGISDSPYSLGENNLDRYPLMKPFPWASHDVAITGVTTSKTIGAQGANLSVETMIFNYGENAETINAELFANSTKFGEINNVYLASRDFTMATFTVNSSDFAKGNYLISFFLSIVPGETDTFDNSRTTIVTVTIQGDFNGDFKVSPPDFALLSVAYGSTPDKPKWNPNCDTNDDDKVDPEDFAILCVHYGQHYP
jgi:parallel beta-helix repeat protein